MQADSTKKNESKWFIKNKYSLYIMKAMPISKEYMYKRNIQGM
jgi:hypothetical protein